MNKKVIIFSAPSGAGKTTIVRHILQTFSNFEFSVSATSRTIRGAEKHGIDYFFITSHEFRQRINNNEFIEWEEVYKDCFYGTLKSEIERIWAQNKIVIFDVDVKGGKNLKSIFKEDALSIFIQPPSLEILEERLRNRLTDTEESIKKRIDKASEELTYAKYFDKILINNELEAAKKTAEQIINEFVN